MSSDKSIIMCLLSLTQAFCDMHVENGKKRRGGREVCIYLNKSVKWKKEKLLRADVRQLICELY